MSLFPSFQRDFAPLARMMDEYEQAFRQPMRAATAMSQFRTFNPKFDVAEVKDGYELHGELPGLDQKNINIEWTDGNTLTISGKTEHSYEEGNPQGRIEGESETTSEHEYKKPSVEEEEGASNTQVAKTNDASREVANQDHAPKYWVSERSVGEFHRSFSFPTRVDQDAVKASLKNGILSILVPKASAPATRKVPIEY